MKCSICEGVHDAEKFINIKLKNGEFYSICEQCLDDIFMINFRFDVDIMVSPIKEISFQKVQQFNQFVAPMGYARQNPKFISFYKGEKKAITHIARVMNIDYDVEYNDLEYYFDALKESWMDSKTFQIFNLDHVNELDLWIIRTGKYTIQNRIYVDFELFINAKNIQDLLKTNN